MRRFWIINFSADNEPYQINLLGGVVGTVLGLFGGILGYAYGGSAEPELVRRQRHGHRRT